jgi:hypothetical protein
MRLASLYALLEKSSAISADHLHAAMTVWRYCAASAEYCFGNSVGNRTADTILARVESQPGLTRTDIRDAFQRHKTASEVEEALRLLEDAGLIESVQEPGAGRSTERWFPVGPAL